MTDRIIDISDSPAKLYVRDGCLVIERDEEKEARVPLKEIAVLVLAERRVSLTQHVLSGLAAAAGAVVVCDGRHLPVAMMLPLEGHSTQGERFAAQAAATLPARKRMWRDIVSTKVTSQGKLLAKLRGGDGGLLMLATRVRSGDPENVEGQAARRYWQLLFGDPGFMRDRDAPGRNALLNYGYAVVRAIVARAVCAAGLHPSLGLHHHNRYDSFRLADDLMEPFRPVVDAAVVGIAEGTTDDALQLDRETKTALLEALTARYEHRGERRTLFDLAGRLASSVARVFLGKRKKIDVPEL